MSRGEEVAWERAWLARDPAFDGRFFIGVRTTGVYCRCVCPVRLPYRRNVEFMPSAAAAEAAGFRPCLRCRPETAPFCPAWKGTLTTVERAARLIIEDGIWMSRGHLWMVWLSGWASPVATCDGFSCAIAARRRRQSRERRAFSGRRDYWTRRTGLYPKSPLHRDLAVCGVSTRCSPKFTSGRRAR